MPTVSEASIDDILAELSPWERLTQCEATPLFIAAVGFEDRTAACFEQWCALDSVGKRVAVLIRYLSNRADNEKRLESFVAAARSSNIEILFIEYSRISLYNQMVAVLHGIRDKDSIVLDISSMASFAFYPIMSAVSDAAGNSNVHICYAEAAGYFPRQKEWQEFQRAVETIEDPVARARRFQERHFQSSGVDYVYEPKHFPGENVDVLPTSLVVVPNFSFERVNQMISYVADRYAVDRDASEWLIGMPPNKDINGWRHDALWEMFGKPPHSHSVSTLDYREILRQLHQLWNDKLTIEHLMIAAVGSKAQHLGIFLFLNMHREAGLVISEPRQFTASTYSHGIGQIWHLDLGQVGRFLENLRSWNRIHFRW